MVLNSEPGKDQPEAMKDILVQEITELHTKSTLLARKRLVNLAQFAAKSKNKDLLKHVNDIGEAWQAQQEAMSLLLIRTSVLAEASRGRQAGTPANFDEMLARCRSVIDKAAKELEASA